MKLLVLYVAAIAAVQAQTPAETLIEAGHWKRARALVDPQLRQTPNNPLANFLGSQVSAAFGGRETPLTLAEKAVSLDGSVAKFHRQVAEVTGSMAQHSNMLQQLLLARRFTKEIDRALQLDPRDIQALRDQLEYYLLAPGIVGGDKARAHTVAARIGRIDPAEGFAAEARIASFEKDETRAADLLRKAVAVNPAKYKIWITLARACQAAGRPDQAQAAAEKAIQLDPTRADGYSILAGVLARQGQAAALDSLLQQSDLAVPDDLTPHYRTAEALLANGRSGDAARQLDIYLSQEPEGGEPAAAEARRLRGGIGGRTKPQEHVPN